MLNLRPNNAVAVTTETKTASRRRTTLRLGPAKPETGR